MDHDVPALEGVINLRDLASADPAVRPGRVFRSARPCFATDDDLALLRERLGVRTLIDLRTTREIEEGRDETSPLERACASGALARHAIPLLQPRKFQGAMARRLSRADQLRASGAMLVGGRRKAMEVIRPALNAGGLFALNEILLAESGAEIVRALRLIADPAQHPIAFYCTAGKDRTGLIAALVLAALGVGEAAILADYERSHAHYARYLADPAYGGAVRQAQLDPEVFLAARAPVMAKTFAHLRSQYGGVDGWMDRAGFGAEEREGLRRVLRGA